MATARFVRPLALFVSSVAAFGAIVAGPALSSSAAPQLTIGQAQARIDALNTAAEKITERYNAARENLAGLQRQQKVAADQLGREQTVLTAMRSRIGATANFAYRNGGLTGVVDLSSLENPQSFLDSSAMLDEVSRYQAQQFAAVAAAQHRVASAQVTVAAKAAAAKQVLAGITADKDHINALLAQAHAVLASLRAADRARMARANAAEAGSMAALRGSYNGPASGRAAVAVRFAYNQLGKPYQYGAAGPDSYDCSGLTMRAWEAAGVSLSHNAAAQQGETRSVSRGNLQPGDLVFFGSPAYHVAIYIGNGNVIAAPHTGDVVKIESLSSMPNYSGAGRP